MARLATVLLVLASNAVAADLVVDGVTLELDGVHAFDNVRVINGGVLTHPAGGRLELNVTGLVLVDASSAIDATGKGYAAGRTVGDVTTGAATIRSGGSHGGYGYATDGVTAWATNAAYDDPRDPLLPGAGAGPDNSGGAGGGVVRISAATLDVAGEIRANGADGADYYPNGGGGGAGGSIRLDVGVLQGAGAILAVGGKGNMHCYYGCRNGGSGGGGRIAAYVGSLAGFDLARMNAGGGDSTLDSGAGGAGTVYVELAGGPGQVRIIGSVVSPAAWTPLGLPGDDVVQFENLLVSGAGIVAAPEHDMPILADNVSIASGAILTHLPASLADTHELRLIVRDRLEIDATSSIDVSGRGYLAARGLANRSFGAASGVSGGSHGGLGGYTSNPVYDDPDLPRLPGSGGGPGGPAGNGGGVASIAAGTLVLDGAIRADGANGRGSWGNGAGGGAGGSVLVNAGTLSGAGFASADGGDATYECYYGCRQGGGGGGGRVAVYARDSMAFDPAHLTAAPGTLGWPDAAAAGHEGSVVLATDPRVAWTAPAGAFFHGVETLAWEAYLLDPAMIAVDIDVTGSPAIALGTALPAIGTLAFDTTTVPDGMYDLTASFRDGGADAGTATRQVLVNNAVAWHSGVITANESWAAGIVHVVESNVVVADGVILTLEPGVVVKFAQGTSLHAMPTGSVVASGSEGSPVVLTSLRDDTAGGDTNLDGAASLPRHGDWDGLSGPATLGAWVELRFARAAHGGTLAANETWSPAALHEIVADVIVPSGKTLTIEPGTVVYFARLRGITVQSGGTLIAEGTQALPITFTSVAEGGNPEGLASTGDVPMAGDWRWIHAESGTATFDHVQMRYGGGTASGTWENTGMLRTSGSATVTVRNSVLRDAFFDGILAWGGTVAVTNTIVTGTDRAICAHPGSPVTVTNCTVDDNRIGLLVHGGTLNVINTLVSNSFESGIQYDFGTLASVRMSDVFAPPGSGSVNYRNTADLTGTSGNISADPLFVDRMRGDYRLGYLSPAIDAADGGAAPLTDAVGAPRFDDPRTPNTGLPGPGSEWADMGAREFVETAPSDVDLVVTSVRGPLQAVPGETVTLEWTVANQGTAPVQGPWHDALSLVRDPLQLPRDLPMLEVLSGAGVTLAPGETLARSAEVVVPASTIGPHSWQVVANSWGDVFEGVNAANNATLSAQPVSLDMPELVIDGAPVAGFFDAPGAWRAFKVVPVGGQAFRVALDRQSATGATELRVGEGSMPTLEQYDFRSGEWDAPDAVVAVPEAEPVVHYVLARARTAEAASAFSIAATTSAFGVTSVSPAQGGTTGTVTITILGEALPVDSTVRLVASDATPWAPVSERRTDSTRLSATFALAGAAPGLADVVVMGGGSTRTLDDAFTIVTGGAPGFWFDITGPRTVRAGRQATFTLRWGNRGLVDAPMHVIDVPIPAGTTQRIEPFGAPLTERLLVLTAAPGCTGPVLPPGWTDSRPVYATAMPISWYRFGISALATTDPALAGTAIDWNALEPVVRPEGLGDAAWAAFWSSYTNGLGDDWGTMLAELAENAAAMACEDAGNAQAPRSGGVLLLQAVLDEMDEAMRGLGWDAVVPAGSPRGGLGGVSQEAGGAGPRQHRIRSLIVSIGEGGGTEADFAGPDDAAYRMERYLEGTAQQPWYRNDTLVDRPGRTTDDLTPDAIIDAVDRMVDMTWPGEVGLFYFSGHGGATSLSTKSGGIAFEELHNHLNRALTRTSPPPAEKMVVVLDSCYSGGFIEYLKSVGADPDKWVVVTAAAKDQKSYQPTFSPFDVGFFTDAFANALTRGGSVHSAFSQLPENLNAWSFNTQTAQFWGNDTSFTLQDPDGKAKHRHFGPDGLGATPPPGSRPCTASGTVAPIERAAAVTGTPEECDPDVLVASSFDPNEKVTQGIGARGYVKPDLPITFTIWFENDPAQGATAPVQELLVTDQLSPLLDWQTVELAVIGFGDERVAIPEGRDAFSTIASRPGDPYPITVEAALDRETGLVTWRLTSVDPSTKGIPEDPFAGFLPVNDASGAGQGFVSFRVRPVAGLADGTEIENEATITFDPTFGVNPPIVTNRTLNVIGEPTGCTGDCDIDGVVTHDEMHVGMAIAVERTEPGSCRAMDDDASGNVTVRDLVAALILLRDGCPAGS